MIQVTSLKKCYADKEVLKGLNFNIGFGEIVGLLGLNGAGKSTTMNILTGYLSPTDGKVTIDGFDIQKDPLKARKMIGYLPEQLAFYNEMCVDEYLNFVCDLKGFGAKKALRREHLDSICEQVGLSHMRRRMIRNLSKGYRQRVGFAQALIGNPKLLILDEPTVGLDPSQIIEIRKLISDVGRESTVIVSSHILHEIQAICQRVLVLHEGIIAADGAPDALIAQQNHRIIMRIGGSEAAIRSVLENAGYNCVFLPSREEGTCDVRIESADKVDIRRDVFFILANAQMPILHTYGCESSLEDVFLNLVSEGRHSEGGAV